MGSELGPGPVGRQGRPVDAVAGHRVEGVGDGDDPTAQRDRAAGEAVGIAAAVPALVVVADDLGDVGHRLVDLEDRRSDLAVAPHLRHLLVGETARFEQDGVGDADLADVV